MSHRISKERISVSILASPITRRRALLQLAGCAVSAFGAAESRQIRSGESTIRISISDGEATVSHEMLMAWVQHAVDAVREFYGVFPVRQAQIEIRLVEGRHSVFNGVTFGKSPATLTRISVGQNATEIELMNDWVMTHELVHLAFPSVPRRSHWIEEGLSTYVEPLARLHLRQISEDRFWRDMLRDMPQGLPQEGDEGLDHTHTWGRTYWGGGLFCLFAEVEIRERTKNQVGLQQALRGILTNVGNIQQDEDDLTSVLAAGDKATGVPVLVELYNRWKDSPDHADLDGLWHKLGLSLRNRTEVVYDKRGSAMRQAIIQPMIEPVRRR